MVGWGCGGRGEGGVWGVKDWVVLVKGGLGDWRENGWRGGFVMGDGVGIGGYFRLDWMRWGFTSF